MVSYFSTSSIKLQTATTHASSMHACISHEYLNTFSCRTLLRNTRCNRLVSLSSVAHLRDAVGPLRCIKTAFHRPLFVCRHSSLSVILAPSWHVICRKKIATTINSITMCFFRFYSFFLNNNVPGLLIVNETQRSFENFSSLYYRPKVELLVINATLQRSYK